MAIRIDFALISVEGLNQLGDAGALPKTENAQLGDDAYQGSGDAPLVRAVDFSLSLRLLEPAIKIRAKHLAAADKAVLTEVRRFNPDAGLTDVRAAMNEAAVRAKQEVAMVQRIEKGAPKAPVPGHKK